MKYYIVVNKERKGPYSIEQLKLMKIQPNTKVWRKGMDDWTSVSDVPELKTLLNKNNELQEIPLLHQDEKQLEAQKETFKDDLLEDDKSKINKSELKLGIIIGTVIGIIVVALIIIFNFPKIFRGGNNDADNAPIASIMSPTWSSDVTESQKMVISNLLENMVKVPGGVFGMGAKGGSISVNDYYIGKYEVTQSQWDAVMGTNVSQQCARHLGDRLTGVGENLPMYYVNQQEARAFCDELSRKTGLLFKLPTEVQWEYAAKAAGCDNTIYSGSNNASIVAWYGENYAYASVHPVGQLSPNSLGIYDMSGNVWEWCRETSMMRGGCILHDESKCRVEWSWSEPNYHKGFNRGGFRIVME